MFCHLLYSCINCVSHCRQYTERLNVTMLVWDLCPFVCASWPTGKLEKGEIRMDWGCTRYKGELQRSTVLCFTMARGCSSNFTCMTCKVIIVFFVRLFLYNVGMYIVHDLHVFCRYRATYVFLAISLFYYFFLLTTECSWTRVVTVNKIVCLAESEIRAPTHSCCYTATTITTAKTYSWPRRLPQSLESTQTHGQV